MYENRTVENYLNWTWRVVLRAAASLLRKEIEGLVLACSTLEITD